MRFRHIVLTVLLLTAGIPLLGQKKSQKDSVFRLVQAERAEQITEFGINYRRVKGNARFLHNDTYLLCDSASWNVDAHYIEAFGNVQVIQNNTMLRSERMDYWIDDSRAVFAGGVVELFDKAGNRLRTERLTYITKDSTATFEYGGALKAEDGNVIESRRGNYDGKEGLFTFIDRVEIFMDTVEIKTSEMRYFTETEKAHFGRNTFVWRDNGFLRADAGWYDKNSRIICFADRVYMFDPAYDAWADEVYYDQVSGTTDLYNNAQVLDSTNHTIYLGDHLRYSPPLDSLSERGLLTGNPSIVYCSENENHQTDTMYVRADTFFVYAIPRCELAESEVKAAEKRVDDLMFDFLAKKRADDAVAREKERIEKLRSVGKLPPEWLEKQQQAEADSLAALAAGNPGSGEEPEDEDDGQAPALEQAPQDTVAAVREPVAAVRDTTPVRHILAYNNVKMYRNDIQAACDSMVFTEIDSVARLYGAPVLWNEVRNQLTAEEMSLLVQGGSVTRGNMVTDAWVISRQDSTHFDQIKSTEMLGYFKDNKLYRFDALGGVSAIFYITDDDVVTTINVKESKSLTAAIKDTRAQRMLYVESIKSDVYPVGDLPPEKQRLKDFKWRGDERPASRFEVCARDIRESRRGEYSDVKRPLFVETNKFFDNYIFDLFEQIELEKIAEKKRIKAEQDSLARLEVLKSLEEERLAQEEEARRLDSLSNVRHIPDTLAAVPATPGPDSSTFAGTPAVSDKVLQLVTPAEKIAVPKPEDKLETETAVASSETVTRSAELTRAEKKALKKAEREARRQARKAAREARRAEREARRMARRLAREAEKRENNTDNGTD